MIKSFGILIIHYLFTLELNKKNMMNQVISHIFICNIFKNNKFFQIIDVPKIYEINEIENISEKISLIFHSRLFGLICKFNFNIFIIKIFKKFDAKTLIFLTLILVTSNGFLTHTSQYRVETNDIIIILNFNDYFYQFN